MRVIVRIPRYKWMPKEQCFQALKILVLYVRSVYYAREGLSSFGLVFRQRWASSQTSCRADRDQSWSTESKVITVRGSGLSCHARLIDADSAQWRQRRKIHTKRSSRSPEGNVWCFSHGCWIHTVSASWARFTHTGGIGKCFMLNIRDAISTRARLAKCIRYITDFDPFEEG